MTDEKKKVLSYIDEKADVIIDTSDKIWDFAELSLREFKSGELYAQVLKEEGFEVEHPFCGIETAFRASYGSGKPVIGTLAACKTSGFSIRSTAAAARTLPAMSMALWAMEVRPQDTFCQEWPGALDGYVAVLICAVGTSQLMSPTSVEPMRGCSE